MSAARTTVNRTETAREERHSARSSPTLPIPAVPLPQTAGQLPRAVGARTLLPLASDAVSEAAREPKARFAFSAHAIVPNRRCPETMKAKIPILIAVGLAALL